MIIYRLIQQEYILLTFYLKAYITDIYTLIDIIIINIMLDYDKFIAITIFSG